METGILLESGTNELEILVFTIDGNHYGINVAKIKEIIPYQKPTPVPNSNPCIEGIIMPRTDLISVIDLSKSLHLREDKNERGHMLIITNFNSLHTAFHVHNIKGIHRISWEQIEVPDQTIQGSGTCIATGIVKIENQLILILDFERIVSDICPETGLKVSDMNYFTGRERNEIPILVAEDSEFLKTLICECLQKAGYCNITTKSNGLKAWEYLKELKNKGNLLSFVACVITDIEMPQMDGHHLTKRIKEDEQLKQLPVIIFSSLVNEEMKRKGAKLGADMQLSKPEIGQLVTGIDQLLNR